jgi:hypothetical protein
LILLFAAAIMRSPILFRQTLFLLVALTTMQARAELSQKQVTKLITRTAGLELPSKAVRVGKIRQLGSDVAETTADVELIFRLMQNGSGHWFVSEIRTGQDKWEQLEIIARAARVELPTGNCDGADLSMGATVTDPSVKRVRCLIASLLGVHLPSDAVRIKDVSSLGLPLGTQASAIAIALVRVDVRLGKDSRGWHVAEVRCGSPSWINLETVLPAIDLVKRTVATDELNEIAHALEAFRRERGFFVVSDKQPVLINHLSPHYLARVIRLDPWHNPYRYQGERDRFSVSSDGPDGKPNTPDDIVVTNPSR